MLQGADVALTLSQPYGCLVLVPLVMCGSPWGPSVWDLWMEGRKEGVAVQGLFL